MKSVPALVVGCGVMLFALGVIAVFNFGFDLVSKSRAEFDDDP